MKRFALTFIACFIVMTMPCSDFFRAEGWVLTLSKYGYNWKESYDEPQVKFKFGGSIAVVMNCRSTNSLPFNLHFRLLRKEPHDVSSWSSGQYVVHRIRPRQGYLYRSPT